jgi:signal transduction histidine kinase
MREQLPPPSHREDLPPEALRALRSLGETLRASTEPGGLLRGLLREACGLLRAEAGRIRLIGEGDTLATAAHHGSEELMGESPDEPLLRETVVDRREVWDGPPRPDAGRPEHRLALPLVHGETVVGLLEFWKRGGPPSDDGLLRLLAQFATSMVGATALHRDLEARHRQMEAIHDVQFLITVHHDLQEVLDTVVRAARDAFDALECTIRLRERGESGEERMRVAAWAGRPVYERRVWPLRESRIDIRVLGGEVIAIEDALSDPRVRDRAHFRRRGISSLVAAPLRGGDEAIGVLRLYLSHPRRFTDDEKGLIESLAGQAAVAIENARLYHQLQEAHRQTSRSFEELRATQSELVKKEKLAALGEMAALVAHEIRNPLTAVRGFAQRVQRKLDDRPALADSCQIIVDEVDRLNKVIVDVLDFARRLEPQLGEHSLNLLIQDILALEAKVLTERKIEIVTDCAPNLPPVRMDAAQIRQVVLNLIANARHAMSEHGGGTLTLRTRREDGGQALDVGDTGPGIPPEVQAKLFTPFFTTKTHGTGLGLTVAQRILQDHGGRIDHVTAEGKGTTFTVHLTA